MIKLTQNKQKRNSKIGDQWTRRQRKSMKPNASYLKRWIILINLYLDWLRGNKLAILGIKEKINITDSINIKKII